jgi:hypothetical protein
MQVQVRRTNLGPMWPLFIRKAKSRCIRVTSGGMMAAPGPHCKLMSYRDGGEPCAVEAVVEGLLS